MVFCLGLGGAIAGGVGWAVVVVGGGGGGGGGGVGHDSKGMDRSSQFS